MSPVIRISDSLHDRLKAIAEPFVDTTAADVIGRLLDDYEKRQGVRAVAQSPIQDSVRIIDPEAFDDLRHTKVLSAKIDGKTVRNGWNPLAVAIHSEAVKRLGSIEKVQKITSARISKGEINERGFRYIEDGEFSIQYGDSGHSWKSVLNLAQKLGMSVEVRVRWYDKPEAVFPGEEGLLSWKP